MVYGIYQSAGGLLVNQYRMEVLANNLANAETPGFKQDLAVVRERRNEAAARMAGLDASDPRLRGMTGGSLVAPTVTSFDQGPIEKTGQPLDVALTGEGFFQVEGPNGGQYYTRDGRFTVNDAGELVTVAGDHKVLDHAGAPITVPTEARNGLRIDAGGQVVNGDQVLGQLGIVAFDDKTLLAKSGSNLLESLGAKATPLNDASIETGAIEKSGVDPTRAMVSLIEVNRSYQMNATLIGLADSTMGRAVNDIARLR
jgi:flagellar basal-body rod protein FlgG